MNISDRIELLISKDADSSGILAKQAHGSSDVANLDSFARNIREKSIFKVLLNSAVLDGIANVQEQKMEVS